MDAFEERLKKLRFSKPSKRLDERILGARYKFNMLPGLLPGETVLLFEKWVWLWSVKSFPTYRINVSLPPLSEAGLYVTDRRLLVVVHLLRLFSVDFSQWFEGKTEPEDHDIVKEARVGQSRLGFQFLEVLSENQTKHWWRSPSLRLRLYMRDPQSVRGLIPLPSSES